MITSTRNPKVAAATRLKKRAFREQDRRFLVEGAQAVTEALDAGLVEELFHVPTADGARHPLAVRAEQNGVEVQAVSEQVMGHLTSTVTPQGLVAVARFVDVALADVATSSLVPVLCAVRDPGNAGTILRSADAAGADAVVFGATSVDVYNSKTVRASAGSLFHLPVVRAADVEETVLRLREGGAQVIAAAADGDVSVHEIDLTGPTAILLGNEAWGLSDEVAALADRTVRVPIAGRVESLNLAAAATVILFEAARQRAGGVQAAPVPAAGEIGPTARLISASAHNIRSPLTILKGFAVTLARSWDRLREDQRTELLEGMRVEAERTAYVVKSLIDLARLEEGTLDLAREPVDLADAARWVASLYPPEHEYPKVEVSGSAMALGDLDRLQSVVLSLCDAARWLVGRGPIEAVASEEDGAARLDLSRGTAGDYDPDEVARMLEDRLPQRGEVTLWLPRRIVEALGGELTADTSGGLRFRISVPGTQP